MGTKIELSQINNIFDIPIYLRNTNLELIDNNITLNATNSSTSSSVGSGLTIKDGNGLDDISFEIIELNTLTNVDTSEYTGTVGSENRGWATELKDIVVEYDPASDTGYRLIHEKDLEDFESNFDISASASFYENNTSVETNSTNGYNSGNLTVVAHTYTIDVTDTDFYSMFLNLELFCDKKNTKFKFGWYINGQKLNRYYKNSNLDSDEVIKDNSIKYVLLNSGSNTIEVRYACKQSSKSISVKNSSILIIQ